VIFGYFPIMSESQVLPEEIQPYRQLLRPKAPCVIAGKTADQRDALPIEFKTARKIDGSQEPAKPLHSSASSTTLTVSRCLTINFDDTRQIFNIFFWN
jgi:hypothetical protein